MKRVVLLGATGSIGENTLAVLRAHPDKLRLIGVGACRNAQKLAAICREFSVPHAALTDPVAANASPPPPPLTKLHTGPDSLSILATLPEADIVLVAVVGTAGLAPALAALAAGKDLALASKEILVLAGPFVLAAAKASGARLLPVDSEHNAVFQCLTGHSADDVRHIHLTASGGAFRDWPAARLAHATPADALRHPNWSMGPKITVDSATLANKGLELIEAQILFGLRPDQCHAVLHPQSIVHALVEYTDGSIMAQMTPPSMTFPIQHALLHPDRAPDAARTTLDFTQTLSLDFRPIDPARYPMLGLARAAMHAGGAAPAVYNAANEIAVAAFLAGRLPYLAIPQVVEQTLSTIPIDMMTTPTELSAVLAADAEARRIAEQKAEGLKA
ncbi:1-deoxy-D-xylulose-5-phosphate reductoisomerase [Geminisphaera colitermitum]|uniref:1-deoxy-D-xylulose-5-phosphate reductoisomerase n=1 Tax=Geminisphaera colitermitum TaxID=1148786 RepID=UPI000158CC11|nr:1-deoxy-D-xylulose-5-phosphate reductoisomerase [Geminisphaera colitermitum]